MTIPTAAPKLAVGGSGRRAALSVLKYLVIAAIFLFLIFPVYWMLVTSLNVVGDAVTSICVAKSEGLLNERKYNAR